MVLKRGVARVHFCYISEFLFVFKLILLAARDAYVVHHPSKLDSTI